MEPVVRLKLLSDQLIGDRVCPRHSVVELGEKRAKEMFASRVAVETTEELSEPLAALGAGLTTPPLRVDPTDTTPESPEETEVVSVSTEKPKSKKK